MAEPTPEEVAQQELEAIQAREQASLNRPELDLIAEEMGQPRTRGQVRQAAAAQPTPLTPVQQQAAQQVAAETGADPASITVEQIEAFIQNDIRLQKLAWIGQMLGVDVSSELDFADLYQRMVARGGALASGLNLRNRGPDESLEEFMQRVVTDELIKGPILGNLVVVEGWAVAQGILARQSKTETPFGDVYAWQIDELTSFPALRGFEVDVVGIAREQGVDPLAAGDLLQTAIETGLVEPFGPGRTPTGTEAREGPGGQTLQPYQPRAQGDLLKDYAEGMAMYQGDAYFAKLHAVNPQLAAKVADPELAYTAITREEREQMQEVLQTITPATIGFRQATAQWFTQLWGGVGAGGGGGGESIPRGQVRESLLQLSQAWNLGPMSDGELENLVSSFVQKSVSEIRANRPHPLDQVATGGVGVTDTPTAQEFLRTTDRYRELYGRKSTGEAEEEYAYRFKSAAEGFLGNVGDNMAFEQAGMRTGDVQTTLGVASFSPEAQRSSTFLGRMAQTAETVRNFT